MYVCVCVCVRVCVAGRALGSRKTLYMCVCVCVAGRASLMAQW